MYSVIVFALFVSCVSAAGITQQQITGNEDTYVTASPIYTPGRQRFSFANAPSFAPNYAIQSNGGNVLEPNYYVSPAQRAKGLPSYAPVIRKWKKFTPSVPSLSSAPSFASIPSLSATPSFSSTPSLLAPPAFASIPSIPAQHSFSYGPSFSSAPSFGSIPSYSNAASFGYVNQVPETAAAPSTFGANFGGQTFTRNDAQQVQQTTV